MKISAVLIVKNEEKKLERCLKSLTEFFSEIIIVDTGSTDKTISIAKKYTSKLYSFHWNNNFSDARNYSLSKSTGDYNLIIDADEYITHFDTQEIKKFITKSNHLGKIKITNLLNKNNLPLIQTEYITRFIPKGIIYTGAIHEQVDSLFVRNIIPIEIEHDGYLKRSQEKSTRNIEIIQEELKINPENAYLLFQISLEYYGNKEYYIANKYFQECNRLIDIKDTFYPQFIVKYILLCKNLPDYTRGLSLIESNESFLKDYPDFYFESGGFYLEYILNNLESSADFISIVETCYLAALSIGETKKYSSLNGTGSFLSQYNLGLYYEMTKEKQKAVDYYTLASKLGYKPAKDRLNNILKKEI